MTLKDALNRLTDFGAQHQSILKRDPALSMPQIADLGAQSVLSGGEAVKIGSKDTIDNVGKQYKILVDNTVGEIPTFIEGCNDQIRLFFSNFNTQIYADSNGSKKIKVPMGGRGVTIRDQMEAQINMRKNNLEKTNVVFSDIIDANCGLADSYTALIGTFSLMKTEGLQGIGEDLLDKMKSLKDLSFEPDWIKKLQEAEVEIGHRRVNSTSPHKYLFMILEVYYGILIKCLELANMYGEIIEIRGSGEKTRESMILYQTINKQIETTLAKENAYFEDNHEQKGTPPEVTDPGYLEKMTKILEAHKNIMKNLQSGAEHCNNELPDSYK